MKKFLCILLLVMSMGTMYYFSSQDGKTSSAQSGPVVEIVDKLFDKARENITLSDDRLINLKDKVMSKLRTYKKSVLVRKAAHFCIYAVIGGLMMIVLYSFSKQVFFSGVIALVGAFTYAVFDERRQLTIDGRSGSMTDVFIDSSGALLAILILSALILTGKGIGFIFGRRRDEELDIDEENFN